MSGITYDFTVLNSDSPNVRLIMAQNEEAFNYLTEETDLQILSDGSAPVLDYEVESFITNAEHCHLCTAYA